MHILSSNPNLSPRQLNTLLPHSTSLQEHLILMIYHLNQPSTSLLSSWSSIQLQIILQCNISLHQRIFLPNTTSKQYTILIPRSRCMNQRTKPLPNTTLIIHRFPIIKYPTKRLCILSELISKLLSFTKFKTLRHWSLILSFRKSILYIHYSSWFFKVRMLFNKIIILHRCSLLSMSFLPNLWRWYYLREHQLKLLKMAMIITTTFNFVRNFIFVLLLRNSLNKVFIQHDRIITSLWMLFQLFKLLPC